MLAALLALAPGACARGASEGPCSAACPIIGASLDLSFDPGHSGSRLRYEVERADGRDVVRLLRSGPRIDEATGELRLQLGSVERSEAVERTAEQIDRFFAALAERGACRAESPDGVIGLHPTFHTLVMRDACGNERTVKWVSGGSSSQPSRELDRIRAAFDSFFEPEGDR